jgi:hypothetical protein
MGIVSPRATNEGHSRGTCTVEHDTRERRDNNNRRDYGNDRQRDYKKDDGNEGRDKWQSNRNNDKQSQEMGRYSGSYKYERHQPWVGSHDRSRQKSGYNTDY